ncbi:type II secretion system protein [Oceanisphaera sp. IT1-181]|uniref:pilus assembly FimT family protein n=1 Tax=Oceanisphaera sp. IT1-181 TaxID=3081199 RepID=UPI0029CAA643|nr:type II secretion system protein [Oceanisphaera sp. IT1-181]
MRKSAGFTLIELVIVIVILGILGAVAAPKFLNLQGDAYKANINALKSSIQSAANLAHTKAILLGQDKGSAAAVDIDGTNVAFYNGYPIATNTGILLMLQDHGSLSSSYTITPGTNVKPLILSPKNRDTSAATDNDKKCQVEYTQARAEATTGGGEDGNAAVTETKTATVTAFTKGC